MTREDILPLLGGLEKDIDLRVTPECGSTNSELKRLAPSLPGIAVLIAQRQSAGRGRVGRSFYSPPGSGLYMSILTRPRLSPEDLTLLTPAAAVSVCGAIEDISDARAEIKWVNDVYSGGRKVCGILTESALAPGGAALYCVTGIGVNISPPPGGFPEDIAGVAGAVFPHSRPEALPALAAGIIRRFLALLPDIPSRSFVPEYRSRSMLTGRDIWVIRGDSRLAARVEGIDGRCGLIVSYPGGDRQTLYSGEVTVRVRGGETCTCAPTT